MESAFILGGSAGASSADGLDWANLSAGNALDAWDFLTDQARFNSVAVGPLANTPGWSYARSDAQTAYAQTSAGVLTPFATGELRRTDKGVLIEGARTNLCLQSQTFGTTWTNTASSESLDAIAAPDGTTTADKLVEDGTAATQHRLLQSVTTTAAAHTFSVYAKAGERSWLYLRFNNSVPENCYAWFNVTTGAVGSVLGTGVTSSIEALGNGWYRCVMKVATAAAASNTHIIGLTTGDAVTDYNGDNASGLYLWGAQAELGAFPSSYIPTTTASATRAADVLTVPVSGIDYPLSLYAEFEITTASSPATMILLQTDAGSNSNYFRIAVNTSNLFRYVTVSGGVADGDQTVAGAITVGATTKGAARSTTNDVIGAKGGSLGTKDSATTAIAAAPTTIQFGRASGGGNELFGYLRRAAIWTRALTDSELQTVTT